MKVHKPVANVFKISSPYGFRVDSVTKTEGTFHYGIDFATPTGTPVVACWPGQIFKAGFQDPEDKSKGFGLRVWQTAKIDGKPVSIFYAHLSEMDVVEGQQVEAGQRIGLTGNTGKSSGPHLHFEIREEGKKGIEIQFL